MPFISIITVEPLIIKFNGPVIAEFAALSFKKAFSRQLFNALGVHPISPL